MSTLKIISPGIPALCTSIGWNGTYGDFYPLKNSINGRRHCMSKLTSAVAQQWMQFDLGSNVSQAVDHLYFAQAPFPQRLTLTGCAASINTPLELATQPTAWFDFSDDSQVTQSATRTISAVANKGTAGGTIVQATENAKPVRTRSDNRENICLQSQDMTKAGYWVAVNASATSITEVVEDETVNSAHYINITRPKIFPGQQYRWSASIKRGVGSRNVSLYSTTRGSAGTGIVQLNIDLSDGSILYASPTLDSYSVIFDGDYYNISLTFTCNGTDSDILRFRFYDGTVGTYDGDGASSLHITNVSFQSSLADPAYIATTTFPQYRGVNGRSAARFSGAQYMSSTLTLANLFAAGAKTMFIVSRPGATTAASTWVIGDSGEWVLYLQTSASKYWTRNYDVNSDSVTWGSAFSPGTVYIGEVVHDGTNLTLNQNNGTALSVASGNTGGAMNGTMKLGGGQAGYGYVIGDLCAILTWNVVLSEADRAAVYEWAYAKFGGGYAYQNLDFGKEIYYASFDLDTDGVSPYTGDIVARANLASIVARANLASYPARDVLIPITQTAAYRYWWFEIEQGYTLSTPCIDPIGKIYFGLQVDPGVDCQSFLYSSDPGNNTAFETGAGGSIMASMRAVKDFVYLTWQNVTAANLTPLLAALNGYGRDASFCLYATNTDILAGKELAHVRLVPGSLSHTWQDTTEAGITRFKVEVRFEVLTDYLPVPQSWMYMEDV